jgi:hypothetical protein
MSRNVERTVLPTTVRTRPACSTTKSRLVPSFAERTSTGLTSPEATREAFTRSLGTGTGVTAGRTTVGPGDVAGSGVADAGATTAASDTATVMVAAQSARTVRDGVMGTSG